MVGRLRSSVALRPHQTRRVPERNHPNQEEGWRLPLVVPTASRDTIRRCAGRHRTVRPMETGSRCTTITSHFRSANGHIGDRRDPRHDGQGNKRQEHHQTKRRRLEHMAPPIPRLPKDHEHVAPCRRRRQQTAGESRAHMRCLRLSEQEEWRKISLACSHQRG